MQMGTIMGSIGKYLNSLLDVHMQFSLVVAEFKSSIDLPIEEGKYSSNSWEIKADSNITLCIQILNTS